MKSYLWMYMDGSPIRIGTYWNMDLLNDSSNIIDGIKKVKDFCLDPRRFSENNLCKA